MVSWAEFEKAEPAFAAEVRSRFAVRKHATLATIRADGSPRISGTEVEFDGSEVRLGSMLRARKAHDLARDPRMALHSPTEDAPEGNDKGWLGEAKLSGRVVDETDRSPGVEVDSHAYRVDIHEVVLTRLTPEGTQLWVRSWHPGRGLDEVRRD